MNDRDARQPSAGSAVPGAYPVTILMYHSIDETPDPRHAHHLTPAAFERQIEFLTRTYPIVRLSDLLRPDGWPGERRLIITFDDGLQDFRRYAFPILERLGVPATMFVPSQFVGKADVMTERELQALEASGLVDIGSHTANHVRMGPLAIDRMREEACRSKAELEAIVGHDILTFAYPFGQRGDFSRASTRVLAEAGYRLAVTTCWGTTNSPARPLTLKRIALAETDDDRVTRAKVEGAYDWIAVRERVGFVARRLTRPIKGGLRSVRRLATAA